MLFSKSFTLVRRVREIHQGHLASCNQNHSGLSKESLKWYYISAIFSIAPVLMITSLSLHFTLSLLSSLSFLYSFQLLFLFYFFCRGGRWSCEYLLSSLSWAKYKYILSISVISVENYM